MWTWLKFGLLLLQVTQQIMGYLERNKLIADGERKQIAAALAEVARKANIAKQIKLEVDKLTDAQVDDALRGDYRD